MPNLYPPVCQFIIFIFPHDLYAFDTVAVRYRFFLIPANAAFLGPAAPPLLHFKKSEQAMALIPGPCREIKLIGIGLDGLIKREIQRP
jgi:hypothetical protein